MNGHGKSLLRENSYAPGECKVSLLSMILTMYLKCVVLPESSV